MSARATFVGVPLCIDVFSAKLTQIIAMNTVA